MHFPYSGENATKFLNHIRIYHKETSPLNVVVTFSLLKETQGNSIYSLPELQQPMVRQKIEDGDVLMGRELLPASTNPSRPCSLPETWSAQETEGKVR